MSLLLKVFGQNYRVRYEGITYDGITFSGTTEIRVAFASNVEIKSKLKNALFVDSGLDAKTFEIVGVVKTN